MNTKEEKEVITSSKENNTEQKAEKVEVEKKTSKTTKKTTKKAAEKNSEYNPLNPANLPVPNTFDIEKSLTKIEDVDENGKPTVTKYMPVAARLAWFLQNNPNIPSPLTQLVSADNGIIIYEATLADENGKILANAHGVDMLANYSPEYAYMAYLKAETQAVGRVLRNRGYGIAFDDETGNEGQPIDEKPIDGKIPSLNETINAEEQPKLKAKNKETKNLPNDETSVDFVCFDSLSQLEKNIAVLKAPYPISIDFGGENLKGETTWVIAAKLKKAGNGLDILVNSLNWGISKNLQKELSEESDLTYPVFAKTLLNLLEDKEAYKNALNEIKKRDFNKG
jgi:hypothetical protein